MSELRERVAKAAAEAWYRRPVSDEFMTTPCAGSHGFYDISDAVIAAVLDAMQEPSEGMLAAVVNEPTHLYGLDGRGAQYERDMKNAVAVEKLMKQQDWQDMLTAFRTEALPSSP